MTPVPRVRTRLRPPPRAAAGTAADGARWRAQVEAFGKLIRSTWGFACEGRRPPTAKLRKYLRRRGLWTDPANAKPWPLPSDPALAAAARTGPAGRHVWVEARGAAARRLGREACKLAARCGLRCDVPPSTLTGRAAEIRRLAWVRARGDLVLQIETTGRASWSVPVPVLHAEPALTRAIRAALPGVASFEPVAASRFIPGLRVSTSGADPREPRRLAHALCRLGSRVPDLHQAAWLGTAKAREERGRMLAAWLGLRFVDRFVPPGRPPHEARYIARHYGANFPGLRRRPSDGAFVMREPALLVIHYTATLSLRSALATLRAVQVRRRLGSKNSLGVGVPYLVDRQGGVYRLLRDDARFARHAIGINHSAIGIENLGGRRHPLTAAQIRANAALVAYVAMRHPLRYLLAHREIYRLATTRYFVERITSYCSDKPDPAASTMRKLRQAVAYLGVAEPPTKPALASCREQWRYHRQNPRWREKILSACSAAGPGKVLP